MAEENRENPLVGGEAALEFRDVADGVWARDLLPGQGTERSFPPVGELSSRGDHFDVVG